jgi:hypothetical protein
VLRLLFSERQMGENYSANTSIAGGIMFGRAWVDVDK